MHFTELGQITLTCGTIVYSYMRCEGGYLINIRNIDTGEEINTSGINVRRTYLLEIMERLMENSIVPSNAAEFLCNEINRYYEVYPPTPSKSHSKYLYL